MQDTIILKVGEYTILKQEGNRLYIRDKKHKVKRKLIKL